MLFKKFKVTLIFYLKHSFSIFLLQIVVGKDEYLYLLISFKLLETSQKC